MPRMFRRATPTLRIGRRASGLALTAVAVVLGGMPTAARADDHVPAAELLTAVNATRAAAGVPPVALDATMTQGCREWVDYLHLNGGFATEFHDETPGRPGYTELGRRAAQRANGGFSLRVAERPIFSAPKHRVGFLHPVPTRPVLPSAGSVATPTPASGTRSTRTPTCSPPVGPRPSPARTRSRPMARPAPGPSSARRSHRRFPAFDSVSPSAPTASISRVCMSSSTTTTSPERGWATPAGRRCSARAAGRCWPRYSAGRCSCRRTRSSSAGRIASRRRTHRSPPARRRSGPPSRASRHEPDRRSRTC